MRKILAFIFVLLLDHSKLHELENEFLEILEDFTDQMQVKTQELGLAVDDGEVIVNQQSGSKLNPNTPSPTNNRLGLLSNLNSRCRVDDSVLQQDIFGLTKNVLQNTFTNKDEVRPTDETLTFNFKRSHIQNEKNVIAIAEQSTRNLLIGGKDLRLILGPDWFREMIIVNRIKNLHNLWFLSDLNSDQMITYFKLLISSLNNKGMFIKVHKKLFLFI